MCGRYILSDAQAVARILKEIEEERLQESRYNVAAQMAVLVILKLAGIFHCAGHSPSTFKFNVFMNDPIPTIARIISGGQTGADRAGLDWAIENGIPHGGYCPKGRLAEDGPVPARHCLTELHSRLYPARTIKNAAEADGTIIFTIAPQLTAGSKLTAKAAEKAGKPWLHICVAEPLRITIPEVQSFVASHGIKVLNVAGSRGKEPKLGECVKLALSAAFGRL